MFTSVAFWSCVPAVSRAGLYLRRGYNSKVQSFKIMLHNTRSICLLVYPAYYILHGTTRHHIILMWYHMWYYMVPHVALHGHISAEFQSHKLFSCSQNVFYKAKAPFLWLLSYYALDATGTGILFFDFYRILMTLMSLQPDHSVLWLFENVVHMNKETKETISRFLEVSQNYYKKTIFGFQDQNLHKYDKTLSEFLERSHESYKNTISRYLEVWAAQSDYLFTRTGFLFGVLVRLLLPFCHRASSNSTNTRLLIVFIHMYIPCN